MKDIIGVIGLGYVGLPLAVAFSKKYNIIGYDKNSSRVEELNSFKDSTGEVPRSKLKKAINLNRLNLITTAEVNKLHNASIFIVTVPTPIDHNKNPDLKPLIKASETIGKYISKNNLVIFESTVYPGTTEEVCIPIIESVSKLKFNEEFFVGYSPERINPGDKKRTIDKIIKITSGSNDKTAIKVDNLYKEIIKAGTYLAPSIKIAEAAKVIENSQRDINIAFMNELSKIFNLLNIDTKEVLKAASTKWNFLDFQPGLVGGHCIGVDPYYLAYKSINAGYNPEIILSGRTINDSMPIFIYNQINKLLKQKKINKTSLKILILGFTFKENCPDHRNTKVIEIFNQFSSDKNEVIVVDPKVNVEEVNREYGIKIYTEIPKNKYDILILAVPHNQFLKLNFNSFLNSKSIVYDVKGVLKFKTDGRL